VAYVRWGTAVNATVRVRGAKRRRRVAREKVGRVERREEERRGRSMVFSRARQLLRAHASSRELCACACVADGAQGDDVRLSIRHDIFCSNHKHNKQIYSLCSPLQKLSTIQVCFYPTILVHPFPHNFGVCFLILMTSPSTVTSQPATHRKPSHNLVHIFISATLRL
jgi:hypothetical protein